MAELSPEELKAMWPVVWAELQQAQSVVVSSHINPDGDAIGSAVAFSMMLDQVQIDHDLVMHHDPPKNLMFLPGTDRIKHQTRFENPDLFVVVDLEASSRLGDTILPILNSAKRVLVIDHHVPHEKPGDVRVISVKSPATAAMLFDLFEGNGIEITADMATNLMTGIITDTGSFKYPNTTPHSMHVAAALLEAGANLREIIEEVYMTRSLPSTKMLGHVLAEMHTECNGQIAYSSIPFSMFSAEGATDEDTEGVVNEMLAVDGVKIAALLRESKPGKIRGSIRSRGKIDVAAAAREFGGGGHENAAGVSFDGDIKVAEGQLVEALVRCLESY